ncbi:MAG: carboxypeptidase regulatory-like domain-containing protein [Acidobacteriaceae bacterium]
MRTCLRGAAFLSIAVFILLCAPCAGAQSIGNAGSITGTVTDPSGAVVPGAVVTIQNPVSQYLRKTTSDAAGHFQFTNVPFNPYHMTVTKTGFGAFVQDVDVRSNVAVTEPVKLQVGTAATTIEVTGEDLLENSPTFHTDVDRDLFQKVPLESQSSSLSSLVTLTSPGVAADSNGLFHGLGDHASNSFSIDGQSITDQQSKVFSNQPPSNSIQSIEVISGAPPAEYGDKTSLVIVATTRSGQGVTKPTGTISTSYGTFGSSTVNANLSYGGTTWGNFIEGDGLNTGRFLDPPEFVVFHDKGNEENFFDRVDYNITNSDSVHLNLNYSRSWFQTPNAFQNVDVQNVVNGTGTGASPTFANVGDADQRSKIGTFNIYPSYTHIIGPDSVFNLGAWVRKDLYNYFPSSNPLADLGPSNLQTSSISQIRTLMNTAIHADYSYVKGINNLKIGAQYGQTFLRESDTLGIVDNTYNSPCMDVNGNPLPGYSSQADCNSATVLPNGNYIPVLAPYDLTRGGSSYYYFGHTDVKELALYIEDQLNIGNWVAKLGLREDVYNGLADANQTEPRLGVSYRVKPTNTVLGISYARTLETPFNENLVLSSQGCTNAVLAPLLACSPTVTGTGVVSANLQPGFRNEFHADIQQAFGKHAVVSGEYIWKYTHNAFDFSVLGNTPITFPIDWHNSKIPGFALRAEMPTWGGVSAYTVMSSVAARFFPPQVAGAGATSGVAVGYPFRIDHDERYNETTHLQYQIPGRHSPWFGFNWRFDSGLVAGSAPCYNVTDPNSACPNSSLGPDGNPATLNGQPAVALVDNGIPAGSNPVSGAPAALPLTADEEFQSGLACNGDRATPTHLIGTPVTIGGTTYYECPANELTSDLLSIPAPGTGDNDHSPPRVAPRSLFDMSLGEDNLFHGDKYKWGAQVTAINVTNRYALYNFLSTFSGTHYVTPRAITGQISFSF